MSHATQQVEEVVIRFAGDSGDGMQLTGGRFTDTTAIVGNDLSSLSAIDSMELFVTLLIFSIFSSRSMSLL